MTIKKFFAFSILAHLIILFGIYFLPTDREMKHEEFYATLIFPEEVKKPEIKPPQKKTKPVQPVTPPLKEMRPVPFVPQTKKISPPPTVPPIKPIPSPPQPQVAPIKPRRTPSTEKPVVPGEGKDKGMPLPEGIHPKIGEKDKKVGEGIDRKDFLKPGYSEREKIFDREIIGDIAKKDFGSFDKQMRRDNSITFDTKEYRYAGYMKKLRERIENIWVYPPEARVRGIYGDLKIRFTIMKNGKIGAIELVRTSGYKMLDDAAMKALRDGEPYWPLPDEWNMESYTILGHFVYYIYGFYVR